VIPISNTILPVTADLPSPPEQRRDPSRGPWLSDLVYGGRTTEVVEKVDDKYMATKSGKFYT
jgi:hypothetical protein